MGINVGEAVRQANKLENSADNLRVANNSLESLQSTLNSAWQADEMVYVNRAINEINKDLLNIVNQLNKVESQIVSTAYEIKREEEREKAEREAAERAKEEAARKR